MNKEEKIQKLKQYLIKNKGLTLVSTIQELLNITENEAEGICKILIRDGKARKGKSQVAERDLFSIEII
ncbi:MAG: hypothetical protein IMY72_05490 [Bacteroidetes bacterium]|nr:hypothetical protein [Bacteroidota bacterium]